MARITLSTHWKFQRLARVVGSKVLARGILETLWEPCWVAGDAYCGTSSDIEALCEWAGAAGALTTALLMADAKGAGFIEPYEGRMRDTKEPHYQIHDFLHHCPEYVRSRRDREAELTAPKNCIVCGGEFFSRNHRSQTCGDRCRQVASRKRIGETDGTAARAPAKKAVSQSNCDTNCDSEPIDRADSGAKEPCHSECHSAVTVGHDSSRSVTPLTHTLTHTHTLTVQKDQEHRSTTTAAPKSDGAPAAAATNDDDDDPPGLEVDDAPTPPAAPSSGPQTRAVAMPAAEPSLVVLSFPTVGKGGPVWYLRDAQLVEWQALYPNLDVLSEARQALAWIQADQSRRKTAGGMPKCLVGWFNRSVNRPMSRGPTVLTGSLKTAGNKAALESFLRRRNALD